MNILVLGGRGRTGKVFAKLATNNNHQVAAIVRDKNRGTLPKVKYLEGSPTDRQLLNNQESDKYTATQGKPKGGSISRAGVAKFVLEALETEKYVRDVVTLY